MPNLKTFLANTTVSFTILASVTIPISTPAANAQPIPPTVLECVRTDCYMGIIRGGSAIRDQAFPSNELKIQRQREQYNQRVNQNLQRSLFRPRTNGCLTAAQCQQPSHNGLRRIN